ncbi:hypothetical protein Vau01_084430 [Virgisporangium aurantiacum]|uniref:Uncharacterized protein n=1 Tax=Virgisporangium aurantiacum TaxID=175570 RepID=A0A8J4E6K7_9ACTN|nr:hypothetical protein Vau01_084430 [Virgisporangium aurantiacum]
MRTLTRDAFLDAVLHDDDLLRAEFDAIVAAAWPEPPAPPPPAAPATPGDRPAARPGSPGPWPPKTLRTRLPAPARRWYCRQRSPPDRKGVMLHDLKICDTS